MAAGAMATPPWSLTMLVVVVIVLLVVSLGVWAGYPRFKSYRARQAKVSSHSRHSACWAAATL